MSSKGTILVTGGAGYIGCHICILLIQSGYVPVIIDDLSNAYSSAIKAVEVICGCPVIFYQNSITDILFVSDVINRHQIDAVIHLAAKKSVEESVLDPLLYFDSNVTGLIHLLRAMAKSEVKPIVYSSSATVYAPNSQSGIYNESDPLEPINPYGWTKFMGEKILQDMEQQSLITPAILRYFNPVGAHESGLIGEHPKGKSNNLMPILAEVVTGQRKHLTIYGNDYDTIDGTAVRDFIHVMDVADAHVKAIDILLENKKSFTLNIGTGKGHSVKQIIDTYKRVNQIELATVMAGRRLGDAPNICANVDKAKQTMGWAATRDIDDMCRDLHKWVMGKAAREGIRNE